MLVAGAVRAAIQQAATVYGDAEAVERIRRIRAGLDQQGTRRDTVLAAWSALQALDELVRDDPPATGTQHLRHRLDRIRADSREVAEVTAIDELRSEPGDLSPDDVEAAARLLGDGAADNCHRLGLEPDAGPAQITQAVQHALTQWRARASHPGTAHSVRRVATTVVRSCEHLLLTGSPPAAKPAAADPGSTPDPRRSP